MSIWKDPPRLSDEGAEISRFLRDALLEARKKRNTDARVQRIAERLSPIMRSKVPISIAIKAGVEPGPTGMSVTGKILGAALCLGILSAAFYFGTRDRQPAKPARIETRPEINPVNSLPLLPEVVKTNKAEQEQSQRVEQPRLVRTTKSQTKSRRPIKQSTGLVHTIEPSVFNPKDELALLRRAQQALDQQPRQTLELTEQHLNLYPNGIFGQEREMLAIEALSKLGKRELARERGRRFLERYPDSAHARRIDNLLERQR